MNKRLFYFIALLGSMTLFAPACGDSDPCKDVECGANGACFEGTCICDEGYEQDANGQCTVLTADKFIGQYSVEEDCSASASSSYTTTITAGTGLNGVNITNFWGLFQNSVKATIDGNTITIARQEPDNDDYFVQGSGTVVVGANGKSTITFTYTVSDESVSPIANDVCTNTIYTEI